MSELVTYKIIGDKDDKLKKTAKISCNFWNYFLVPKTPVIIQLDVFTSPGNVIARAYRPYENSGSKYGRIEFNTEFLDEFTDYEIAGTIIHEIGHTLGFGWDIWMDLFYHDTGDFKSEYFKEIPELKGMAVETDYKPGTKYSHWDEKEFDEELMTGIKDDKEHVLPVTIKIMKLFGHRIVKDLSDKTDLEELMRMNEEVMFTLQDEVSKLDLVYHEDTELMEDVYSKK